MRYIIAAATAFALIAGIALGFVLRGGAFEAEAKPPPEVQPVEEQNLDGSGFIRVHEQGTAAVHETGTANVNVTNPSLPVTGTVDIGNPPQSRLILVAEDVDLSGGGFFRSDFVDTSDCSRIVIFVDPPSTNSPSVWLSVDGVTVNAAVGGTPVRAGMATGVWYIDYGLPFDYGLPVISPKVAVAFGSGAVVNEAWVYCSR